MSDRRHAHPAAVPVPRLDGLFDLHGRSADPHAQRPGAVSGLMFVNPDSGPGTFPTPIHVDLPTSGPSIALLQQPLPLAQNLTCQPECGYASSSAPRTTRSVPSSRR